MILRITSHIYLFEKMRSQNNNYILYVKINMSDTLPTFVYIYDYPCNDMKVLTYFSYHLPLDERAINIKKVEGPVYKYKDKKGTWKFVTEPSDITVQIASSPN